jgi:hypothetical protein
VRRRRWRLRGHGGGSVAGLRGGAIPHGIAAGRITNF